MGEELGLGGDLEELFELCRSMSLPDREVALAAVRERDPGLAQEVESLLAAHDASRGPLDSRGLKLRPIVSRLLSGLQREAPRETKLGSSDGEMKDFRPPKPRSWTAGFHPREGQETGGFRLIRLIGIGGMGQVWEAQQLSLQRRVALKLIRPDRLHPDTLRLFAREARAGGRLQNPGIVTVHGFGESEGVAWIALEFVEGGRTLRDLMLETARLIQPPQRYDRLVATLVSQMARALQAAHAAGIIHHDLKPQNVLLTEEGHPKITDFGLARLDDESSLSPDGGFRGTYVYSSPEQLAGRRGAIDHRTDIFSLGIILYEMLTLRRPFEGDSALQVATQIREHDPAAPRSIRSRIPRDLEVICMRALEKDRERRYPTMGELGADLERWLRDEPILARPPSALERAVKWTKRNPAKSGIGAVALLAFVAIAVALARYVEKDAALMDEIEDRRRLADRLDHDGLLSGADALWPILPERIPEYRAWIVRAEALVARLPAHQRKLAELADRARHSSGTGAGGAQLPSHLHSRVLELDAEIGARSRALQRIRHGSRAELPVLDAERWPSDADSLLREAAERLGQDRSRFGEEELGLALAMLALQRSRDGELTRAALWVVAGHLELGELGQGRAVLDTWASSGARISDELAAERDALAHRLEEIRQPAGLRVREQDLERLAKERDELESRAREEAVPVFPSGMQDEEWWYTQLGDLIERLEGLMDPRQGLLAEDGISTSHGWSIRKRLVHAEWLRERFGAGGEFVDRWAEARVAIRNHPAYAALELPHQMGLVPLGPDPDSGLWLFWHPMTGVEPARDATTRRVLPCPDMGIVLVLLPGGEFHWGAQSTDREAPNYDPDALADEGPVRRVEISPFFISKFEMTQAQWEQLTPANPSAFSREDGGWYRVESVSWSESVRVLHWGGLRLPSEAQWEYAARAGTSTPWWTGTEPSSLATHRAANLADASAVRARAQWGESREWSDFDDGHTTHAPVGSFAPNPFGLHDVIGNVREWCEDLYDFYLYQRHHERDPRARPEQGSIHVARGGSFSDSSRWARVTFRFDDTGIGNYGIGLRPARAVDGIR